MQKTGFLLLAVFLITSCQGTPTAEPMKSSEGANLPTQTVLSPQTSFMPPTSLTAQPTPHPDWLPRQSVSNQQTLLKPEYLDCDAESAKAVAAVEKMFGTGNARTPAEVATRENAKRRAMSDAMNQAIIYCTDANVRRQQAFAAAVAPSGDQGPLAAGIPTPNPCPALKALYNKLVNDLTVEASHRKVEIKSKLAVGTPAYNAAMAGESTWLSKRVAEVKVAYMADASAAGCPD